MAAAAAAGPSPGSGPGDSPEGPEGEAPERRRKAHGMLKLYYGLSEGEAAGRPAGPDPLDPTDLNGAHFDPEVYLDKLRRECPLAQLMDSETDMVRQIRALDSDMQTLVYENYNKFISATGSALDTQMRLGASGPCLGCLWSDGAVEAQWWQLAKHLRPASDLD
ncbi:VPS51 isoform 12 [Pan troglodytes]|uniref:Vacuolar protein sorting-associated protein 51 homolog n=2 Tax=Homininae TaxID=207598 RepID=E9PQD5_HUMAN|nr:VPS51 subunit of GARP complex [Homo sapiens]KAI4072187.1 VPS51 subunit of GARP complex [Homo sapiens]PNI93907.1 VPS51 isoform 12 [Pan troglodytes]